MPEGSFNLVYKTGVERESGVQAPLRRGSLKLSIEDAHLDIPGSKHHGTRQRRRLFLRAFYSPRAPPPYSSKLTRAFYKPHRPVRGDGGGVFLPGSTRRAGCCPCS